MYVYMQAAGLQCLKLQLAAASSDPQTRAFPGKSGHPIRCAVSGVHYGQFS